MNMVLSAEWFDNHFVPDALRKCKELNLDGKVLLFMDNAPGHARYLIGRHPAVQVEFLPPNTMSVIQPLDQEIIANVKLIYYKKIYDKMREVTDDQEELKVIQEEESDDDELLLGPKLDTADQPRPSQQPQTASSAIISVRQFWKNFNVKNAIDYMTEACKSITNDTIKHAWHPLLPDLVSASTGKWQHKTNLLREAVEAARNIPAPGFADVDEAVVCELLEPDETSAEEMIEDNELEVMAEEEKSTETVEEKIVTAGYLSRKITDPAQMKNYLCETGSSESEWWEEKEGRKEGQLDQQTYNSEGRKCLGQREEKEKEGRKRKEGRKDN
ncbi:hypothetical protein Pcinc_037935 [Petrolisthes cinctipes]|uniref:DDE-1 domain-containing protein n=2 Tax=Petrolisthes cinctipes TaxID=88211 RepID=A0AAE1BSJ5_PETCI|nr:hypothetical protein Pcinc_037935 [Petrolisthes cinctipes]